MYKYYDSIAISFVNPDGVAEDALSFGMKLIAVNCIAYDQMKPEQKADCACGEATYLFEIYSIFERDRGQLSHILNSFVEVTILDDNARAELQKNLDEEESE